MNLIENPRIASFPIKLSEKIRRAVHVLWKKFRVLSQRKISAREKEKGTEE